MVYMWIISTNILNKFIKQLFNTLNCYGKTFFKLIYIYIYKCVA